MSSPARHPNRSGSLLGILLIASALLLPAQNPGTVRINPKDGLPYAWVPAGKALLGCSDGTGNECEGIRRTTIPKGLWVGQTEVTQAAYRRLMGTAAAPAAFAFRGPGDLPADSVNWESARRYCAAAGMRLPTRAEWEYAARAGSLAQAYGEPNRIAWFNQNSGLTTHPVKSLQPNAWGIYDMLGNVAEWTFEQTAGEYVPSAFVRGVSFHSGLPSISASSEGEMAVTMHAPEFGVRCVGESLGNTPQPRPIITTPIKKRWFVKPQVPSSSAPVTTSFSPGDVRTNPIDGQDYVWIPPAGSVWGARMATTSANRMKSQLARWRSLEASGSAKSR